tara:strand:+ start:11483 stop:14287 length:2805 start_codon:yes stop_codon:yes gene_type:complete
MFLKAQLQNRTDDLWFLLKCLVEEIQDDVLLKLDKPFDFDKLMLLASKERIPYVREKTKTLLGKTTKELMSSLEDEEISHIDKLAIKAALDTFRGPREKITGKNPFLDRLNEENKKFYDKLERAGEKEAADRKTEAQKYIKRFKLKDLSEKYPTLSKLNKIPLYAALFHAEKKLKLKTKKEILNHLNQAEKRRNVNFLSSEQEKDLNDEIISQIKAIQDNTFSTNKTGLEIFEILEKEKDVKALKELLEDDDYKKFLKKISQKVKNRLSQKVKIESIVDSEGDKSDEEKEKIAIEQNPRKYFDMYQSIATLLDKISQDPDIQESTKRKVSQIRSVLDKRFKEMQKDLGEQPKGEKYFDLKVESAKEVPKTTIDFWNNLRGELVVIKNNIEGKSIEEIKDEGGIRLKQLISSLLGLTSEGVVLEIINNIILFDEKNKKREFDWYQYKFNNNTKKMQKIESRYVSSSKGYKRLDTAITATKELLTDGNKKSSLLENINKITLFTGIKNPFSDKKIASIARRSPKEAKKRIKDISILYQGLKDFNVSRSTIRKITKLKGGTKKMRSIIETIPINLSDTIFGDGKAFDSLENYLLSWNVISSAGNFFNEETDKPEHIREGRDIGLNITENSFNALLANIKREEKKEAIGSENKEKLKNMRDKANEIAYELNKLSETRFDKFIEEAQKTNAIIKKAEASAKNLTRYAKEYETSVKDLDNKIKNYKLGDISLEKLKQMKAQKLRAFTRTMNLIEKPFKEVRTLYDVEGKPVFEEGTKKVKTEEVTAKNFNERKDMRIQFTKSLFKKRHGIDLPTEEEINNYEKKQKEIEAYSVLLKDTISDHKEVVKKVEEETEKQIELESKPIIGLATLSDERIKNLKNVIDKIELEKIPNKQMKIDALKKLINIHTEEKEKWLAMDKEEKQNWYDTQIIGLKTKEKDD